MRIMPPRVGSTPLRAGLVACSYEWLLGQQGAGGFAGGMAFLPSW